MNSTTVTHDSRKTKPFYQDMSVQVFAGMALGALIGWLWPQSAEWMRRVRLLFFETTFRDDVSPSLNFRAHSLVERFRRDWARIESDLLKPRLYIRLFKTFCCCPAEYVYSRYRHVLRTVKRIPRDHYEIRNAGFLHRWHVG